MFNKLFNIMVLNGLTPPEDMPIPQDSFTIETWHVLLVAGILIGLLLLPKFISYVKKINDSIDEDDTKNGE